MLSTTSRKQTKITTSFNPLTRVSNVQKLSAELLNVQPFASVGQICNWCKWRHVVAKFREAILLKKLPFYENFHKGGGVTILWNTRMVDVLFDDGEAMEGWVLSGSYFFTSSARLSPRARWRPSLSYFSCPPCLGCCVGRGRVAVAFLLTGVMRM